MTKRSTPNRRTSRKQTSERVSRIAARLLKIEKFFAFPTGRMVPNYDITEEVHALAASCLSQDEVAGSALTQKTKVKRVKRKRGRK